MAAKFRRGDRVIVMSGRDKGQRGEILTMFPTEERAIVKGVNIVKKHQRQTAQSQGGIISKEATIHVSNLAHEDPSDGSPTRVGFRFEGEGDDRKKVRFAKKSGEAIPARNVPEKRT
ncbi:MAG: 50S ribosomal protein L24 [Pseudomonadota bacterium]